MFLQYVDNEVLYLKKGFISQLVEGMGILFTISVKQVDHENKERGDIGLVYYHIRPLAHCAGEMFKRSFISTVRPTVHTNPSRKRSFISTVRPTIHTNPSRKRSLRTPALRLSVDKSILKTEFFGNDDVTIIT